MRMRFRYTLVVAIALLTTAVALSACGSSSDDGSASGGGTSEGGPTEINATWLYTGPLEDGGWNKSQRVAMEATEKMPGVTVKSTDNMPYSQQATQVINQAIAGGSNLISETLGLGTLMTTACQQSPDVYCYGQGDPAPQPENSVSYWVEGWDLAYIAGVAAGLTTDSGTLGYVAASKIPLITESINAYALGCQSVRPDCDLRVIFLNSYYDPPANAAATRSLINAGADVIYSFVDDPSSCQAAEKAGVHAVGQFEDYTSVCPDATITSTVWTITDFWEEQIELIQEGKFKSSGEEPFFIPVTDGPGGPHIGEFGSEVTPDVQKQIEDITQKIVDGEDVLVGPIKDQSGNVKIKAGEVLTPRFLMSEWDWFVEGVTASE